MFVEGPFHALPPGGTVGWLWNYAESCNYGGASCTRKKHRHSLKTSKELRRAQKPVEQRNHDAELLLPSAFSSALKKLEQQNSPVIETVEILDNLRSRGYGRSTGSPGNLEKWLSIKSEKRDIELTPDFSSVPGGDNDATLPDGCRTGQFGLPQY